VVYCALDAKAAMEVCGELPMIAEIRNFDWTTEGGALKYKKECPPCTGSCEFFEGHPKAEGGGEALQNEKCGSHHLTRIYIYVYLQVPGILGDRCHE
jgi:hypothetical protein